jgi:serine/threonine-protein kinase RsbT
MPSEGSASEVGVRFNDDLVELLVQVRTFAVRQGLSTLCTSVVSTVVSELGTNLIKYARNGRVRFGFLDAARRRVYVESMDEGPGIADLESAMQEHFSTGGSLGMGLPGVRRLSNRFEIESTLGKGTRVWCELEV